MLRSVERILQYSIHELDKYGYTILPGETAACGKHYSIRQIRASASITHPGPYPLQEIIISGRMLDGKCIAFHKSGFFGPSEGREIQLWYLEAEGPIQYVSYYKKTSEPSVKNLTLGLLPRERIIRQKIDRIYLYLYKGGQFSLEDTFEHLQTETGGLVQEIHVPKTIALEPWIGYFSDPDGQILRDPSHPWQDWFRKLGAGYVQKSVNR